MKKIFLFIVTGIFLLACNNEKQQITYLLKTGELYEENGMSDSALVYYNKAITLLKPTKDMKTIGETYNRIGNLYLNNELEWDALKTFQKAFYYNSTLNDQSLASHSLRGIGKSYMYRFMPDSALFYYSAAFKLIRRIQNKEEIANIHNNLSNFHFESGQYNTALYHINKALSFSKDSDNIYRSYSAKADIFIKMHYYDSARIYFDKGLYSTNLYTQAVCNNGLSQIHQLAGDSSGYIKYKTECYNLVDSIEQQSHTTNIVTIDKKLMQKNIGEQKRYFTFIISSCILASILAGCYLLYYHRKKIEKKNKLLQEYQSTEYKTQAQINAILNNMKEIGEACKNKFIKSATYQILKDRIKSGVMLSYKEQEKYSSLLIEYFNPYIQSLAGTVTISSRDQILCCLFFIGFKVNECTCFRSTSEKGIRTQKSRLMQKIKKVFGKDITFEYFFNLPQKQKRIRIKHE